MSRFRKLAAKPAFELNFPNQARELLQQNKSAISPSWTPGSLSAGANAAESVFTSPLALPLGKMAVGGMLGLEPGEFEAISGKVEAMYKTTVAPFGRGVCDEASQALHHYLVTANRSLKGRIVEVEHFKTNGELVHAWLKVEALVLDPTAGQFVIPNFARVPYYGSVSGYAVEGEILRILKAER